MKYANIARTAYKMYLDNVNVKLHSHLSMFLLADLSNLVIEFIAMSECEHFAIVILMYPKMFRFVWFAEIINTQREKLYFCVNNNKGYPHFNDFSQKTVDDFNEDITIMQKRVKMEASARGKGFKTRKESCVAWYYYKNAKCIDIDTHNIV